MEWTTIKPDFKEDCVLVTATRMKDHWEYHVWEIKRVNYGGGSYMAWLDASDGEEYGELEELTADKYLILPKHQ